MIHCVILVFITLNVWFNYPETKDHSLEEMSLVFDKDQAIVEVPEVRSEGSSQKGSDVEEVQQVERKV